MWVLVRMVVQVAELQEMVMVVWLCNQHHNLVGLVLQEVMEERGGRLVLVVAAQAAQDKTSLRIMLVARAV